MIKFLTKVGDHLMKSVIDCIQHGRFLISLPIAAIFMNGEMFVPSYFEDHMQLKEVRALLLFNHKT